MEIERRAAALEVRAAGRKLEGYAATFGAEARIGSIVETIAAGAFAATLADRHDVLALVDHDPGRLLARTRSGTLRLAEDGRGLAFALDVPDTQLGHDVLELARRGDLGGMSFAFQVGQGGEHWSGKHRELRAVELAEISVVLAWPAYPDTEVAVRNRPLEPPTARIHAMARWRA